MSLCDCRHPVSLDCDIDPDGRKVENRSEEGNDSERDPGTCWCMMVVDGFHANKQAYEGS